VVPRPDCRPPGAVRGVVGHLCGNLSKSGSMPIGRLGGGARSKAASRREGRRQSVQRAQRSSSPVRPSRPGVLAAAVRVDVGGHHRLVSSCRWGASRHEATKAYGPSASVPASPGVIRRPRPPERGRHVGIEDRRPPATGRPRPEIVCRDGSGAYAQAIHRGSRTTSATLLDALIPLLPGDDRPRRPRSLHRRPADTGGRERRAPDRLDCRSPGSRLAPPVRLHAWPRPGPGRCDRCPDLPASQRRYRRCQHQDQTGQAPDVRPIGRHAPSSPEPARLTSPPTATAGGTRSSVFRSPARRACR